MMHKGTMDTTKLKAGVMTWVSKESAGSTLGGQKVAKGGMEECDGYIICPGNLNDCLQVHQDVDDLVSAESKEVCDSRCGKGVKEKSNGRDEVKEMG
jgi:hypothetical protein